MTTSKVILLLKFPPKPLSKFPENRIFLVWIPQGLQISCSKHPH